MEGVFLSGFFTRCKKECDAAGVRRNGEPKPQSIFFDFSQVYSSRGRLLNGMDFDKDILVELIS
jgi:hypothetical protein